MSKFSEKESGVIYSELFFEFRQEEVNAEHSGMWDDKEDFGRFRFEDKKEKPSGKGWRA